MKAIHQCYNGGCNIAVDAMDEKNVEAILKNTLIFEFISRVLHHFLLIICVNETRKTKKKKKTKLD